MRCKTNRCRTNVLEELDRGINQLMQGISAGDSVRPEDPRLSLTEYENRYMIECDLPGVAQENVSLQIEDSVLKISGQRNAIAADENARVLFNERSGVKFSRQIPLARDVDQSSVDAELNNGVLRITINKRTELMPRRIEIRRASPAAKASEFTR